MPTVYYSGGKQSYTVGSQNKHPRELTDHNRGFTENPNRIQYRLFNKDSRQQLATEEKWTENTGGRNVCSSQVRTAPLGTLKSFHSASPDSDPGPHSQKTTMCDKCVFCCRCFLNLDCICHRKGSFQLKICSIFKHL